MKIAALSDIHGNLVPPDEIGECDVVCICSDICSLDYQRNFAKCISWFCLDFLPWTNKLNCDKVIFIAGNHDFFLEQLYHEKRRGRTPTEVLKCLLVGNHKSQSKLIYLQDNLYEYKGVKFYGTPWIKNLPGWAFNLTEEELQNKFSYIPHNVDVLLTHQASTVGNTGTSLQLISSNKPCDFGSIELTEAAMVRNIKYALCGHIHSGNHEPFIYNNTRYMNVSLLDEDYKIAYKPSIITI